MACRRKTHARRSRQRTAAVRGQLFRVDAARMHLRASLRIVAASTAVSGRKKKPGQGESPYDGEQAGNIAADDIRNAERDVALAKQ